MSNQLFVRLSKLTRQREDLFTECLAATLREELVLARGFTKILCGGNRFEGININSAAIHVETQCAIADHGCRLDMVLTVGDKLRIAVEHKLLSPEGPSQISKYLALPKVHASHVALVTGYFAKAPAGVRDSDPRYLKPSDHVHFLWSQFYELIAGTGDWARTKRTTLQRAMLGLFDAFLFQPEHWYVGHLNSRDEDVRRTADLRMYDLLEPSIRALRHTARSYTVESSWTSQSEIYAVSGKSSRVPEIRIDPRFTPGALKLILKTSSNKKAAEIETILRKGLPERLLRCTVIQQRHRGYSGRGVPYTVEILTPWNYLLGTVRTKAKMRESLERHILRLVDLCA